MPATCIAGISFSSSSVGCGIRFACWMVSMKHRLGSQGVSDLSGCGVNRFSFCEIKKYILIMINFYLTSYDVFQQLGIGEVHGLHFAERVLAG